MDHLVFTKGKTWWSNTICWVLQETYSHVSVRRGDWVYHSDLLGLRCEHINEFKNRQELYHEVAIGKVDNLDELYHKYKHSWYDLGAMMFLGFSLLARRYLRVPMPKSNLWNATGMFICTEWATKVLGKQDSMQTPLGLLKQVEETQQ